MATREKKELALGQEFGKLTITGPAVRDERNRLCYPCRCKCGKELLVFKYSLTSGNTHSCGCLKERSPLVKDQSFGLWTVIERTENDGYQIMYKCCCDCGTIRSVRKDKLVSGQSKSCGCGLKERAERKPLAAGDVFGSLKVIERVYGKDFSEPTYRCSCSCGNEIEVAKSMLTSGAATSCGCQKMRHSVPVNPDDRFGFLTIIERAQVDGKPGIYYRCLCDCGREKVIKKSSLVYGRSTSCGHKFHREKFPLKPGDQFGKLEVIKRVESISPSIVYQCRCDCGNLIDVPKDLLLTDRFESWGCDSPKHQN